MPTSRQPMFVWWGDALVDLRFLDSAHGGLGVGLTLVRRLGG